MLTTYRRVLERRENLAFSAAGLVARLPVAMVSLGIVLMVEDATSSYGTAGAVSAAYVLATAVAALVQGRLVDRLGQTAVLPVAIVVTALSLVGLMVAVEDDWALWSVYVFAALAGAAMPQIGACVRARWAHVLDGGRDLQTAFALESVLDEVTFILGPVLVTVLATSVSPVAGLVVALVSGLVGTLAYAAQHRTAPPHGVARAQGRKDPMPWKLLAPLMLVCLAIGTVFGSAEVITVAFTDSQGAPEMAGPLLAVWAAGSLVAGLITGAMHVTAPPATRIKWGTAGIAVAMAPMAFIDSLWLMAVVLLFGGLAIAPTLIAAIATVEVGVPRSRLTEGMALVNTGIVAGVAPGAALAGVVVDEFGASAAFYVPLAAALFGVIGAQLTRSVYAPGHDD